MGRLVFGWMGVSLDGFVEDETGDFGWGAPHEDVHRMANEWVRELSAMVVGRRMYETMEPYWPDAAKQTDLPEVEAEFARVYMETPRVVISDSLESVGEGVRLVRRADARAEVERLKQESDGPIEIGGPTLAASLLDLIDEFRMWVNPVFLGSGKPFFPAAGGRLDLRLAESRLCEGGVLAVRYQRA
jgi:dihydrofolate reductase